MGYWRDAYLSNIGGRVSCHQKELVHSRCRSRRRHQLGAAAAAGETSDRQDEAPRVSVGHTKTCGRPPRGAHCPTAHVDKCSR